MIHLKSMYCDLGKRFKDRSVLGTITLCICLAYGCGKAVVPGNSRSIGDTTRHHDDAAQLFELGRQAAQAGDSIRSEQYFSLAIEAGFDQRKVLPLLLKVCLQGSRLRSALDHAEPYLLQHPEDHTLRYLLATIHLSLGQVETARLNLKELLRADASNAGAHYLLGVLEMESSPAEAIDHFQTYLSLAPRGNRVAEVKSRLLEMQVRLGPFATSSGQDSSSVTDAHWLSTGKGPSVTLDVNWSDLDSPEHDDGWTNDQHNFALNRTQR